MNQKGIAQLLGVSPSTVSMALHGTGRISDRTREEILSLSREHQVTIRDTKQGVRGADEPAAAVRVGYCGFHTLHGWFHAETFRGMVEQTGIAPHEVVLYVGEPERASDRDQTAAVLKERVLEMGLDGLLLDPSPQLVDQLKDLPIAKVQLGYFNMDPGRLDAVVPDSLWGGYRLTGRLTAKGRRIACIRCQPQDWNSREKFQGYRMALDEAGLPLDMSLVFAGDCRYRSGARCAEELLELPKPPDAVFLENDWMTGDFVQRLREADRPGFRVPDDLALAHFCDSGRETHLPVEIDRVELPRVQMGRMAIRHLLDRIAGRGPAEPVTLKVSPVFRPGGSSRTEAEGHGS